jgi:hypothetical protein
VATDMGPGDKPKKIRGKKKNERVWRKGKMSCYSGINRYRLESCGLCYVLLYGVYMQKVL